MPVFKGKMDLLKHWHPKSMQEIESYMRLWICYTILSLGSLLGITRQCLVMPSSDPRERIVYPIHKLLIDSYNPDSEQQTAQLRRLICTFVVCICIKLVFL